MAECKKCGGKGAVRAVPTSKREAPCYWFNTGARTCPKCDGTGEEDS